MQKYIISAYLVIIVSINFTCSLFAQTEPKMQYSRVGNAIAKRNLSTVDCYSRPFNMAASFSTHIRLAEYYALICMMYIAYVDEEKKIFIKLYAKKQQINEIEGTPQKKNKDQRQHKSTRIKQIETEKITYSSEAYKKVFARTWNWLCM